MVLDSLVQAVLCNHPAAIIFLAMEVDDINNITICGRSLLYVAVSAGSVEAAEALSSVGALWRDHGEEVDVLLRRALATDSASKMKALIVTDAIQHTACDDSGFTYLHIAASNGLVAIAKMLVDLGFDVDRQTQEGLTALHEAAVSGCHQVVEILLSRGADVEKRADEGFTALHLAAMMGHSKIIELLCAQGSRHYINRLDYNNRTALSLALLFGQIETVKLLRSKGALL